ncbi:NAD(P)-dependent dehydrogenase (short-subunit alcohol dehydrogenase family) [Allocatelliglobosispora scoriae]|uniref:NAD(P)-dependent dehydrogenase (Short-subunit alcohol dehydrogenase family) n=1 Tax=Allocatelliglobosispora scoriae TaxID=643052 RepID=A0A841C0F3_9ACTN|nr:SDR family oxidoreductase [Allocatelliglobosispora scoriae]MBB5873336.1 NAD(P)-dependent dehydrogenase (short-subunit alcohol dehydrogenase family) [Allocatelliglobosispora scoriae]
MSKVVVVTGGTRGIGQGLVREFAARGAKVVFCGRSHEAVERASALVPGAFGVVADVTDRDAVRHLWDAAVERFGAVDIWVNNAGMSLPNRKLWEHEPADLDAIIDLNLRGLLHASAVVLGAMTAQGHGALWNMEGFGSNGMTRAGMTPYGSTKRAVTYATDSLAKEVEGTGVTVHHLSPGIVATDLLRGDYTAQEWAKAKKIFNILADRVETVTPWLAEKVLAGKSNGGRVAWLTRGKAFARFATAFRKRDIFGEES